MQGSEALAQIELYTAAGATSINGTYTLAKTQAAGTAMSSPGGDAQYDYPCFIGTDISDQGYDTSYYMITGTVTVTDNSVSYNATSYFGSTLTGSYSGTVTVEDKTQSSVIAKTIAINQTKKAMKKENLTKKVTIK